MVSTLDSSGPMETGIAQSEFDSLAAAYGEQWGLSLFVADPDGAYVLGNCVGLQTESDTCKALLRRAINESLRWGEPTIHNYPENQLVWAVPLMHNREVLGGIIAYIDETRVFQPDFDIRRACAALRILLEEANLTNAALLEKNRDASSREQFRAEAIQTFKRQSSFGLEETFMREEPALLAAMRRDDWGEARQRINNILVAMLHLSEGNLELTKSYFMELVVTMCRTGMEAGGDPKELLGANYANIVELAGIATEDELAAWLHKTLDHVVTAVHRRVQKSTPVLLNKALVYLSEHFTENITRDQVAGMAGMSPSHFSRMFTKHVGRSFVDFLNQMRVDRAAEFLVRTDKPLAMIAMDAGFLDQSYFTKVFRKYTDQSPGQYRRARQMRSGA